MLIAWWGHLLIAAMPAYFLWEAYLHDGGAARRRHGAFVCWTAIGKVGLRLTVGAIFWVYVLPALAGFGGEIRTLPGWQDVPRVQKIEFFVFLFHANVVFTIGPLVRFWVIERAPQRSAVST